MISTVLAAFLAYIAYQQWQTTERQRRKELFEMRYEKLLKSFNEFFETTLSHIENGTLTSETHEILVEQSAQKWNEAQFLLKNKDMKKLLQYIIKCRENAENYFEAKEANKKTYIHDHKKLHEYYTIKVYKILEPYLRIEPDYTIWDIIKNLIVGTYEFLTPKWLQKQLKTSVILNLFQNLTNKEQKPT